MSAHRALAASATIALHALAASAQEAAPEAASPAEWSSQCVSVARGGDADCSMEQRLVVQQTGQLVIVVSVRVPHGPAMLVQLPLGLFLPAGIQLGVDDRATQNLPVQRCDANGCYAGLPVDPALLAALKTGKALRLTMRNMAQEPVTFEVPLAGFGAAFERID
jgi:invasion protein IalB